MKKILSALLLFVVLFSLSSCTSAEEVIKVQFVPSNTASEIMLKTKALEKLLEEQIPGKKFEISVGTNYNAVVEAMQSKQVQVGFLTAQQYAYATTEMPGTAEVILTSVRSALEVQLLPKSEQIAAMNAAGYTGQLSTTQSVTSYASILIVKNATYASEGADKINVITDLAGKTVCTQATTSGAGYVYPAVLFNQHELKFVTGEPNAANKEVKSILVGTGYPGAVDGLMNDDCDAAFVFQDARSNTTVLTNHPTIFTDTKVVALSPDIYNDTISVIPSMSNDLKTKIQNAFIEIAKLEVGKAAISVYSHTGYNKAVDADYNGEREVYLFKKEHLS